MADLEAAAWSETAASNIQPSPDGWPSNSSPNIVYTTDREMMGALKRDWNRRNATVTSGGSANAQTLNYTQNPTALIQGQRYAFIAGFGNTGATTLAIGALAPKPIVVYGAFLAGGELLAGLISEVIYDGTNFQLIAGSGSGSGAYLPLAGGTLTGPLGVSSANAVINLIKGGPSQSASITTYRGTNARWAVIPGDSGTESSGNAGSNFAIYRYNDAGAFLDAPLSMLRTTGQATFTVAIVNGPSDRSLKENIAPLDGALDKVKALQGVSFNMKATPGKREIGLIAQDVEPVIPEIIQQFATTDAEGKEADLKLALDYPKLTALLIEAVKTLTARIEVLEAKAAALPA